MQQIDRQVIFIPQREAILVVDPGDFALRFYDPAMKHSLLVELPLSSALSVCYITGLKVDTQQQNQSYKRSSTKSSSYYTSGKPSAYDERMKRKAMEAANALPSSSAANGEDTLTSGASMWDVLASMPLSRPMRMENGQPVLPHKHAHTANQQEEADRPQLEHEIEEGAVFGIAGRKKEKSADDKNARSNSPPASQLFSEFTAKVYYNQTASTHAFTAGINTGGPNVSVLNSPPPSTAGHRRAGSTAGSPTFSRSSAPIGSSGRAPFVFLQEDYLVTATSQHLQIWDGFPTGPTHLCDSRKIKNSYSVIKWCPVLQKLFTGDVLGNIDVWKIQLLPVSSATGAGNGSGSNSSMASSSSSSASNVNGLKPSLVKERTLTGHTDIITGLETITSMNFLLSCSLDASVRMFDLQGGVEKNRFIGHRAGCVAIAYSNEYRFLLSAGSDHQVCVWSPFAEKQVYSLRGHTSPLIGVQFVPGTPQIVTADSDGWMRVWDARNFACCQVFQTGMGTNLTGFTACSQRHKRIFLVGKSHELLIWEQEGGPFLKRKKEEPIFTALYSPFTMTLLTANREDLKIWDGLTGNLSRVYRGLTDCDLSSVCLDGRQRKLFVGDAAGKIRCYNFLTGAYMKSLTPHPPHEEIIFLDYSNAKRMLVSATDRSIIVHDERPIEEQLTYMTTSCAEGTEFLSVAISEKLSALAAAMSNGRIDIWHLDQSMRDVPIAGGHPDVITCLCFIDSHQLLLSADDSGTIMAWFVRPSRWKGQLAFTLHTPAVPKDKAAAAATAAAVAAAAAAAPDAAATSSASPSKVSPNRQPRSLKHPGAQQQQHQQPVNVDPILSVNRVSKYVTAAQQLHVRASLCRPCHCCAGRRGRVLTLPACLAASPSLLSSSAVRQCARHQLAGVPPSYVYSVLRSSQRAHPELAAAAAARLPGAGDG